MNLNLMMNDDDDLKPRITVFGVGGAGFFMMKKKNGGNKTAAKFEPEFDDETEIAEEDEDEMNFYDHQDDEE